MNMLYQLLLARKREFDYLLLLISVLILCCSIILNHGKNSLFLVFLEIISPLLLGLCFLGLWAWYRYSKYEYYAKRIRKEYNRVLHQQDYKMKRLTTDESAVLLLLLNNTSTAEIVKQLNLPYTRIYQCLEHLLAKLEISRKEGLLDINWRNALS